MTRHKRGDTLGWDVIGAAFTGATAIACNGARHVDWRRQRPALIARRERRVVPTSLDFGPSLTDSPIGVIGHAVTGLLH